jgi:hypothetical protein
MDEVVALKAKVETLTKTVNKKTKKDGKSDKSSASSSNSNSNGNDKCKRKGKKGDGKEVSCSLRFSIRLQPLLIREFQRSLMEKSIGGVWSLASGAITALISARQRTERQATPAPIQTTSSRIARQQFMQQWLSLRRQESDFCTQLSSNAGPSASASSHFLLLEHCSVGGGHKL